MKLSAVKLLPFMVAALVFSRIAFAAEPSPPATTASEPIYATVNSKTITLKDFQVAYTTYMRDKYYHRQVPEDQLPLAKKEVTDRLIDRILLLDEAKRRRIVSDENRVALTLADYETRYAASPMWQKNRDTLLPGLKQQLAEQDVLRQMEELGHAFPEPTDEAVQNFYKTRIDLFTEPEKLRLHTILLTVDPSSSKPVWDAAREEAGRIVARLRSGEAQFEDMASLHSNDKSSDKGGDMGYLHLGMIPEPVQKQVEAMPLGKVGDPIDVLEGVAIFRPDGRLPSKIMAYENVAARARDLLKRELSDRTWQTFITGLRSNATIKIMDVVLPTPVQSK